MLRRIINQFKEPIYKDDLKRVLINAFLSSLLIGILSGALNNLLYTTSGFSLIIITCLIGYFVAVRIKSNYFTYHILYPTLSVIFTLLGLIIQNYTEIGLRIGFDGTFLISVRYFFLQFNIFNKGFYDFWNIINVIVIIVTLYYSYRLAKIY
jgi:hypothetical protein